MQRERDDPTKETAAGKTPGKRERTPAPAGPVLDGASGQVIFDSLTALKGQVDQIQQTLDLQTWQVRELQQVRAERDRLQRELDAVRERQEQEAQAKLDDQRGKAKARKQRYLERHGEQARLQDAERARARRARRREQGS